MAGKKSKLDRKLDAFARAAFLDENGKPKSTVWLYGFLLALLFGVVYLGVYLGFGFLFGRSGQATLGTVLLHALITAVVGSIPAVLLAIFLKEDRKALPAYAYIWLAILFALTFFMGLLLCDWANGNGLRDLITLSTLVYMPSLLSILIGGIPTWILWRRERQRQFEAQDEAKSRPSYYNT